MAVRSTKQTGRISNDLRWFFPLFRWSEQPSFRLSVDEPVDHTSAQLRSML